MLKLFSVLVFLWLTEATPIHSPQYGFCRNGEKRPSLKDDSKFYLCENSQWTPRFCFYGYYYNRITGFCQVGPTTPPPTIPLPKPEYCISGEKREDVFDNTKYYFCFEELWWHLSCESGEIFKNNRCRPLPTTTTTTQPTTTTEPEFCETGAYKANPHDCQRFYQCDNGYWVPKNCAGGTGWSQRLLTCDHYDKVCINHHKPNTPSATTPGLIPF